MGTAIHNLEARQLIVTFVLQLFDGFTGAESLAAPVTVSVAGKEVATPKSDRAQYLFFNLPAGPIALDVECPAQAPYYFAKSIPVTLPMSTPLWPAFPDRALANPALLLDDPAQTAGYMTQRALATLLPTAAYPFPPGANLVRGTVRVGATPLAGATVSRAGAPQTYLTGPDGQFVLFFSSVIGVGEAATIQVTHPSHATVSAGVTLLRGRTILQDFVMV